MRKLSPEEWQNLISGAKYIASIVLAVIITFIVIATIAGFFGYIPPTPSSPEATASPQVD